MAKKLKEEPKKLSPNGAMAFAKLLNKETGAEAFNKSKYTEVEHYIDTGNFALNRIISGSIHGGLASGIVSVWGAENSVGKTLHAFLIAKNAIDKNGYQSIIYVDSEGGANRGMLESVGIDMNLVQYVPVETVEDCAVKLITIYKTIATYQETDPDFRALVILDSLGGLVTNKVYTDADKDKQTQDMGLQSRLIGSLLRSCTMPAKKTNCGLLILSQLYDNPNEMFTQKIKNMRGGKSVWYQPSLIVQMSRRLEKGENKKEDNFYESSVIKYFTAKTRNDVRPFLETESILDFKKGFAGNEYYGLIPVAIQLGFIEQKGGWYIVPSYSDKQIRLSQLLGGKEAKKIWDTFIDEFNKKSQEQIAYKNLSNDNSEEIEELKEEIKAKGFSLDFSKDSAELEIEEDEE